MLVFLRRRENEKKAGLDGDRDGGAGAVSVLLKVVSSFDGIGRKGKNDSTLYAINTDDFGGGLRGTLAL